MRLGMDPRIKSEDDVETRWKIGLPLLRPVSPASLKPKKQNAG